jgi:hypothetical protein
MPPDGILAVRGRGRDIDKVVSYLRQLGGVSIRQVMAVSRSRDEDQRL